MMTKEEMQSNLDNNQYSSGVGFFSGANLTYFLAANPISDSMVINAYAKTNSYAFKYALEGGGSYANHTIFLGNSIPNSKIFQKIFKDTKNSRIQLGKKWSFNFSDPKNLDKSFNAKTGKIMDEAVDTIGFSNKNDFVRTGWGIGRNYDDFFNTLKTNNFDLSLFKYKYGEKVAYVERNVKKIVKNMSNAEFEEFTTFLGKKDIAKLEALRNGKNVGINQRVKNAFLNFSKREWNSTKLTKEFNNFFYETLKKSDGEKVVTKLADDFLKAGGKLKNYSGAYYKGLEKELAEAVGKKFASRTFFEKILSNSIVRIATGAAIALPASVSLGIAVTTTAVGMAASTGQENAINNFVNAHQYNLNSYDSLTSEESIVSAHSSYQIENYNKQSLYSAYSQINVASRYLNDLDPISVDENFTSDKVEKVEND